MDLPPGLIGIRTSADLPLKVFDGSLAKEQCSTESQVGVITLRIPESALAMSIFNIEAAPGEVAALGASLGGILQQKISMGLRPADDGTTLKLGNLFQALPVLAAEIELWGVPADHQSEPVAPRLPFLTLPSRCGEPLGISLRVSSWQAPDDEQIVPIDSGSDLAGCDSQPFGPTVAFAMASSTADTPSGAQIEIAAPDDHAPDGRANAQIRDATVVLPKGVTLSSASVAGLESCSDAQFGTGTGAAACPSASRIGSVEMVSSALRTPMTGGLYRPGSPRRTLSAVRGRRRAGGRGQARRRPGNRSGDRSDHRLAIPFAAAPVRAHDSELLRRRPGAAGDPPGMRPPGDDGALRLLRGRDPRSLEREWAQRWRLQLPQGHTV